MLRSKFLSAQTYFTGDPAEVEQSVLFESMSSVGSEALSQSVRTNSTVHNLEEDVELDTECFLLLGIMHCKDRFNRKSEIFYSILKSGS